MKEIIVLRGPRHGTVLSSAQVSCQVHCISFSSKGVKHPVLLE